jgi:hypothetical protein
MTTKYNIGDVVMVPATVNRVTISCKGNVFYDMVKVANSDLTGLSSVLEENIIDILAAYGKRDDRIRTRELISKKISLIKQLREADGFSANEIALIMNMDEYAVLGILSNNES